MQTPRGTFLSAVIVLTAIAILVASLVLITRPDLFSALVSFPDWSNAFLLFLLVGRLIAFAAIWNFKRWGVYLFVLLEFVETGIGVFVLGTFFTLPLRLITAVPMLLVLLGIWYVALKPKWQAFT